MHNYILILPNGVERKIYGCSCKLKEGMSVNLSQINEVDVENYVVKNFVEIRMVTTDKEECFCDYYVYKLV